MRPQPQPKHRERMFKVMAISHEFSSVLKGTCAKIYTVATRKKVLCQPYKTVFQILTAKKGSFYKELTMGGGGSDIRFI